MFSIDYQFHLTPLSLVYFLKVNPGQEKEVDPPLDVFQRINSIPLDCEKGDIVFTGAKRKKKKKKVKEGRVFGYRKLAGRKIVPWSVRLTRFLAGKTSRVVKTAQVNSLATKSL